MNHYVYEITNLINGKKYIGKRSCKCAIEDDKYMGSGTYLKKAIRKYGIDNFQKEILTTCKSEESAFELEKIYIENVKAYKNMMYYNIANGGEGGWGNFAGKTEEEIKSRNIKISNKNKEFLKNNKNSFYGKHHTDFTKRLLREKRKGKYVGVDNFFYGKKHTQESILKMSQARQKYKNENHTQARKVICLTTMEIFNCIKFASEKYGISHRNISSNCNGKLNSAGKHPNTNERMVWMDYNTYLNSSENEINNKILLSNNNMGEQTQVILLNTLEVYPSLKCASKFMKLKSTSSICNCCRGKSKSAGKINGEPARWMYYEDYLKHQESNVS